MLQKQSKRNTVPTIHPITEMNDVIKGISDDDIAIIPCLMGKRNKLTDVLTKETNKKALNIFLLALRATSRTMNYPKQ